MFGPMDEALSRCGHWTIWDTKAPHTRHFRRADVKRNDCPYCALTKEREQHKQEVAMLRAFTPH
jgi:hypothetical protein